MAESEQGDRTEEPTAKRLREAREEGQVPRSRELITASVMLATAGTLLIVARWAGGHWLDALRQAWGTPLPGSGDPHGLLAHVGTLALALLLPVVPLIATAVVAGVSASFLLSGMNFSPKSLGLKWDRVSPMAGLRRLYSLTSVADVPKSLLRVSVVGAAAYALISGQLQELEALPQQPGKQAIGHAIAMAGWAFFVLCGALGAIALIDVPFQLWNHRRQLRMTKTQVRDEFKEAEGNPEVKSRLRMLQRELANRRMMEAIPTADVVLVNPTHYAVALKYKQGQSGAPRVIAKGRELIAQALRERAQAHQVPIVSAPPLTRALYRSTEIGQEIPVKLYQAVAQVLVFVYQLRQYKRYGGKAPVLGDLAVNEEEFGKHYR